MKGKNNIETHKSTEIMKTTKDLHLNQQEIIEDLKGRKNRLDAKFQEDVMDRLKQNFSHNLSWVAESGYKLDLESKQWGFIIEYFEKDNEETFLEKLEAVEKELNAFMKYWRYQGSSNPISSLQSVWEYDVKKDMLHLVRKRVKDYKELTTNTQKS